MGVAGLGRLLVEAGDDREARAALLEALRAHAVDGRWRVREAVATALQRWGGVDVASMLDAMEDWVRQEPARLVPRAVVAATCEPSLLADRAVVERVVAVLDRVTGTLPGAPDRRTDGFRVLRQALGYGWSVAVAADPAQAGSPSHAGPTPPTRTSRGWCARTWPSGARHPDPAELAGRPVGGRALEDPGGSRIIA